VGGGGTGDQLNPTHQQTHQQLSIQRQPEAATSPPAAAAAAADGVARSGGYLTPGINDGWTWDDDYNPRVLVRAAAAFACF